MLRFLVVVCLVAVACLAPGSGGFLGPGLAASPRSFRLWVLLVGGLSGLAALCFCFFLTVYARSALLMAVTVPRLLLRGPRAQSGLETAWWPQGAGGFSVLAILPGFVSPYFVLMLIMLFYFVCVARR